MQNYVFNMFGVSPAFFVSRFGTDFSAEQVLGSCRDVKKLGFKHIQLEIYHKSSFGDWYTGGLQKVLAELSKLGLGVSAFVAHYLGESFSNRSKLDEENDSLSFRDLLRLIEILDPSIPVCIPLLPYDGDREKDRGRAAGKLRKWVSLAEDYSRKLIVEITPASIAGTYSDFLSDTVWKGINNKVGFLLDSGHAHVQGEDIPLLIEAMGKKLAALHVSDNNGKDNLSLPPGQGSIDWERFLSALKWAEYTNSIDLEIAAPAEKTFEDYKTGMVYLVHFLRS